MGTFATTTSLDTLMIGVSFDTATTSLADKCITWAEGEIKKRISGRYDLSGSAFQTSTSIPPIIRDLTEQLSTAFMWENMSRGGGKESLGRAKRLRDHVFSNLDEIQGYKVKLLDTAGAEITEATNGSFRVLSNTDDYHSTFDEDDPLNWKVDPDKLDDISSERS